MLYILILIVGGIASYFLPWYIIAPVVFILTWLKGENPKSASLIGAAAVSTLWLSFTLLLQNTSDINLTDKIGGIFAGESKIPTTGLILTAITLIASMLGALSGSAGVLARQFFKGK